MKLLRTTKRASVALISILIISAFTLILVIAMSEINISTSYQLLNSDADKTEFYNAESCLEEALYRLEQNTDFQTGALLFSNGSTCNINISGNPTKTIDITVYYLDYTQNYQGQLTITKNGEANNLELLNWSKK